MFNIIDTKENTVIRSFWRMEDCMHYMNANGLYDVVRYKIRAF